MGSVEGSIFLAKKLLVDSIWRSANIEGFSTTFPTTDCIINNIPVSTTYAESAFIIGMKRGWEFLLSNLGTTNDLLFLRNLHDITCHNIVPHPGELRTGTVHISGCSYIPPTPNSEKCFNQLSDISMIEDSKQRAAVMFCYLSRGQLFWDGNKRMAQLMTNKILIESGVGVLRIDIGDKKEFSSILVNYYDTGDALGLCKYIYDHIESIEL